MESGQETSLNLARQMAIFRGIAEVLNRSFTLREALDGALHRIVELMDVEAGWIWLADQDTGLFRLAADVNLPAPLAIAGKRRMAGECRCISRMRDGQLTEPVNVIECLRLEEALPDAPEKHRHASVPLVARDEAVGILNLLLAHGRAFTQQELDMLASIGHELAVAIQRARLFEQTREQEHTRRELLQRLLVAQEEERRRIAQDLHDHTGQMMTALIIQLSQLAQQAVKHSPDGAFAAALRHLHGLAEQGLDELRRLVYDLRPSILDDLGLGPAVRWYADTYIRPAGLEADVQVGDLARLPQEVETVAFRIIQEAVTNTLRHAQARRVEIRVDRKGDLVLVMVRDDGVGFDPEEPPRGRTLGLAGMRERAQLVGGTFQVLSVPGVGTTILARLPLGEGGGP